MQKCLRCSIKSPNLGLEFFQKLYWNMENKLDVLTKKLYEEGVGKANAEAEKILGEAKEQAARLLAEVEERARGVREAAAAEADGLKRKAESEMALSARQALTALKQEVTDLVAGQVAGEMAKEAFRDKEFVQEIGRAHV